MLRDGFPGQRLQVLPRSYGSRLLTLPPTSILLTTDAGYFPHARDHGRIRRRGASGAIVIVCTRGQGLCEAGPETWQIHGGQALVIPPRCPHFYRALDGDPWTIWWLHLEGDGVATWMRALGAGEGPVVIEASNIARLSGLVANIVLIMETNASISGLAECSTQAWQLLVSLALHQRNISAEDTGPVKRVQEYIQANLADPISVHQVAQEVGLSASHLSATFRRSTGTSILQFITQSRMARARELLSLTDETIGDVAVSVGYFDPYYFSRAFRRIHGTTASEYRRRSQNSSAG